MTKKQKKTLRRIIISLVLLVVVEVLNHFIELPMWAQVPMYLVPYLVIGYDILIKAGKGVLNRQVFDENFLMAVATIGAVILGEFREGAAVMLFYQIGELFQSIAVGKSRGNIVALMDIRPDYANVMEDGELVQIDPDEVSVGTEIIVNPGEKVPIDGIITKGETTLNTSALTGESLPRSAKEGDEVISGCINMSGVIHLKTTKEFDESTVSKILELVENSSMKKSRSENFITRFAHYYTPAVCYGALTLAILPPVVSMLIGISPAWGEWIIRALTFLVISCPCALVISIPLSFFGGIGCASSQGILVKGSNYLEALSEVTTIVFDKTGTLTKGVFEVREINLANGIKKEEFLFLAAHAEGSSSHPIAQSICKAYGGKVNLDIIKDVQEIAGHGVAVTVEGKQVLAGNLRLMEKYEIKVEESKAIGTIVYVAVDGNFAGSLVISDVMKETTKDAIAGLKKNGIKTVMLTGDAKEVAEDVAKTIGISEYRSELLPANKVEEVERLLESQKEKEKLAFAGDGINDAPVLSRADIGIAMGALGSDAAIEAADIVLMDDDPAKITLAMKIARGTLRIVKQNIVFALAVKAICLLLGAVGIANMWIAIFADVGVMVIAVLNATRALRIK